MKTQFEVSVSNGTGNVVVLQTLEDLTQATQLALAIHQSSASDVAVDVFIKDCAPGDLSLVHLYKVI